MKKFISILLILVCISSFAFADEMDDFISRWNITSKYYCAPTLSTEMLSETTFNGNEWKLAVMYEGGDIKSIGVLSNDLDILLPMCIQAGMMVYRDYSGSELVKYMGDIVYQYISLKSGKTPIMAVFGDYMFNFTERADGYFFVIVGL